MTNNGKCTAHSSLFGGSNPPHTDSNSNENSILQPPEPAIEATFSSGRPADSSAPLMHAKGSLGPAAPGVDEHVWAVAFGIESDTTMTKAQACEKIAQAAKKRDDEIAQLRRLYEQLLKGTP